MASDAASLIGTSYTQSSGVRQPGPPGSEFKGKCKVCDKYAGHEAVDCVETFHVEGKPAKTFRQLFEIHKVMDEHGIYHK